MWIVSAAAVLTAAFLMVFCLRARRTITALRHAQESSSVKLERLQQAFHRFAPQKVVEEIIDRGVSIHGERREVTVLFADIVGFTSLSERMHPETLVRILNGYFQEMSQAITEHRGHTAKFTGDGLMALFGAPASNSWQALDAVWASLAMRRALEKYNKSLCEEGHPPLTIGIGIHRGSVVAGVFGSNEWMEYTVNGDVVNTASRIESLTRKHGVDILISREVRQCLDSRFRVRELPPAEVKGKSEPVVTFAVEGYVEPEAN